MNAKVLMCKNADVQNLQIKEGKSSRKVAISWLPVLSHHRAYRSVHGGLLEKFHLVFSLPIVIVGKAYIP